MELPQLLKRRKIQRLKEKRRRKKLAELERKPQRRVAKSTKRILMTLALINLEIRNSIVLNQTPTNVMPESSMKFINLMRLLLDKKS